METNKLLLSYNLQVGNITYEDMMYLIGYLKLPTVDFKVMLKWTIKDWNNYFDYKYKYYNDLLTEHNEFYDKLIIVNEYDSDSDSD